MTIAIRSYQPSDMVQLYNICLRTGNSGADATGTIDPDLLGHIYAAPYALADPSLCFVVTDCGQPFGYIVGTADTQTFDQWAEQHWWPQIRIKYPFTGSLHGRTRSLVAELHEPHRAGEDYLAEYPAHLHIDLLEPIQSQGHGSQLMAKFLSSLRERSVIGVHLGVGRANQRAIDWYPKFGYQIIRESVSEVIFGLKL